MCLCLMASACSPAEEAPAKKVKNILFIISDDLKASVLSAYGGPVCKTPNLDRLAASGMVFERAYCQGVACSPSRPSFMRSIYYYRTKLQVATIGEHLKKQGIYTARVGKVFHMPVPHAQIDGEDHADVAACWSERHNTKSLETMSPGLYRLLNKGVVTREVEGRDTYGEHRMYTSVESDVVDGSDQADHKVASKAIDLLRERKEANKPFFLAVGFVRPHFPMVQPKRYFDMYPHQDLKVPPLIKGDQDDIPQAGRRHDGAGLNETLEGRQRMWQAYYASVTFMDEQLGRVLDELDRLGLRDSTAIVFTTDHGYHLGEHGFWQKHNLHEEVVRVPLIISGPGIKPGQTQSLSELVDFSPTCSDLLGLPLPTGVQGKSLLPILKNPKATIREVAVSLSPNGKGMGLRHADWAYMNYGGKEEELYDMKKDPLQYTNVIDQPEYAGIRDKARALREEKIKLIQAKRRK